MNAEAARAALDGLAETWGQRYPAIIRLWENAWAEFIPFLDYDVEIRKVLCSTNAIVISSPNLGVFVVNAVGVLCAFSYVVDALPAQCLRRRPGADLLVAAVFRTNWLPCNDVQLHVNAADVLVRCGVDRDGSR